MEISDLIYLINGNDDIYRAYNIKKISVKHNDPNIKSIDDNYYHIFDKNESLTTQFLSQLKSKLDAKRSI